jgi:hypothetical protein
MKQFICFSFFLGIITGMIFAEDEPDTHFIPVLRYEYVHMGNQQYHAPGAGLVIKRGKQAPLPSEERNSLLIAAFDNSYSIMDDLEDGYSNLYHDINFLLERKIKKHLILGIFNSSSSEPVYGGLHTFQTGIGYGYELFRNKYFSSTLGGALVVSDFGINLPDGSPWPVMPLPIIRFTVDSKWIDASFEFLLAKSIYTITIAPEQKIRMTGTFRMEKFRTIEDILFECTLWYRFLHAGIGLGVKNNGIGFTLDDKSKLYESNYYAVFGTLDILFLQLSGGYILKGREV